MVISAKGKVAGAEAVGPPPVATSALVVDDNPVNLKLTQVLLAGEGYSVRVAKDGPSALQMLETFVPQVILLDIGMPGMNGFELARRLASHPRRCEFIVIAVTAFAMKGDDERAIAAGCDGYVSKPIDPDSLIRTITERLAAAARQVRAGSRARESRDSSS